MSIKSISFKALPKPADAWVGTSAADTVKPEKVEGPTKRLTVDIPAELHRRMKTRCANDGCQMSDAVRDLLAKEFPGE